MMTRYLIRVTATATLTNSHYPTGTLCKFYYGYQGSNELVLLWIDAEEIYWNNHPFRDHENNFRVINPDRIKTYGFVAELGARELCKHNIFGLESSNNWSQFMDIVRFEF